MTPTRIDVILAALGMEVLRVRGSRAWCYCVFHESTSTSAFFVRRHGERAGTYHCFACKVGGSLLDLVKHVRSVDEDAAREFIARAGKGFEPARRRVRVMAREPAISRSRFQLPREIVFAPWAEWLSEARDYIVERGLGPEEVEAFRIGYAVSGPLSGRIVIPFLDERGHPGTYSARTLVDDVPKYRTPDERESPILDTIFGSHLWPSLAERRRRAVIVTEGAIDAMSVRRAAPEGALIGALNGSEPLPGQLLVLATFGFVVMATDADEAGDRCAARIRSAIARHSKCERLRLPNDANGMWSAGGNDRILLEKSIAVALSRLSAP